MSVKIKMEIESNELRHHGVKGMKWGVRRYQNYDGTLTTAGRRRYGVSGERKEKTKTRLGSDRYRNSDGSLNKAGKERMYRDMFDMENDTKAQKKYVADSNRWAIESLESNRNVSDASNRLINDIKRANSKRITKPSKNTLDLSNMTDQEMRNAVNRALLERQYNDIFNPPTVSKGRAYVDRLLDDVGDIATITTSAITLALLLKKLK